MKRCMMLLAAGMILLPALRAQECLRRWDEVREDFFFTASSDQGAVGDVVAVDLSVLSGIPGDPYNPYAFQVVGCFDGTVAELLEDVEYSNTFDRMVWNSNFHLHTNDAGEQGFSLIGGLRNQVAREYFPTSDPIHLATLFFRLGGRPGDSSPIRFCSGVFEDQLGNCMRNVLAHWKTKDAHRDPLIYLDARSQTHVSGELRVIEGPATRPAPTLPPRAKVYPEAPTAETAEIHFELTGAVVQPGSTGVPMDLYVTSNYEFSGYALSIRFPREHLELARVAEHTRPGIVRIDNEVGHLGTIMANSMRRIGAEGERVKLATLFFSVKESARDVQELAPSVESYDSFFNWLRIHHDDGRAVANELPVTSEVSPLVISSGVLKIQREATYPGDANLDYEVNLTDPIAILTDLFRGERTIVCPPAADFTADGVVNLTDPIAILQQLYSEPGLETSEATIFCDG